MKPPLRHLPPPRAQGPSAFTTFLQDLQSGCPGCRSVAFVDREGEAVDYAGRGDEFDIKVAAAHWRIILEEAGALPGGIARRIIIDNSRRSYVIERLPEGYALVLICSGRAAFQVSERALSACVRGLCREAGFQTERPIATWVPVEVYPRHPRRRRPEWAHVDGGWQAVDVLGVLMGLRPSERGYRVRLAGGAEVTLVREPLGHWWMDDELD
ncbi:MAG TPA: hypothetical protein VFS43_48145 [Polyangiaceae bacterium]|nr:hypothetical protein [Polyangiaceae bacterium]